MKKRVGIVSLGYAWLPCEKGPSRFYYIARAFCESGWDVDFIGSSFEHFEKKPRDFQLIRRQHYPFKTSFINVPAYKKNIDLRRVFSNAVAADRTVKYLETQRYDAVYCSIPANDVAAKVGEYCHKKGIPFIVDIEDIWPEAMEMVVKNKALQKLIFPYFMKDAEKAYRYADAAVGTSEDYTERAVKYNRRSIPLETVYVGCDLDVFDQGVREFSDQIEKPENEFWITYSGSIGTSYDIKTMVLAGKRLLSDGYDDIKIKILGTGPTKDELMQLSEQEGCTNVEFLGYVDYPKMAAYLSKSDVVVNSFVKGAPQSIVNKIGDYLASGKPMINTLENPVFTHFVEENQVGVNIEPENTEALSSAIIHMHDHYPAELGRNARDTCEEKFDRKTSYKKIVRLTQDCISKTYE